jgi:GT2 family glycosyltransferase
MCYKGQGMVQQSASLGILISVYRSHQTVEGCLLHLRQQTYQDFQVYVFDSSPENDTELLIFQQFPEVKYVHVQKQTNSHLGRNYLIERYPHDFYLALDHDVYAEPDCLERLMSAHNAHPQAALQGSITCYGNRWLDWGIHFCKFGTFLPHRPAVSYRGAATACFAFTHEQWISTSGFRDNFHADHIFALSILDAGFEVIPQPDVIVQHHHLDSFQSFWRERVKRGRRAGLQRVEYENWSREHILLWWFLSRFLIRLPVVCLRFGIYASQAGYLGRYLWALPVVILGFASWMIGEADSFSTLINEKRA